MNQKFEVGVNYIAVSQDGFEKKQKSVIWMSAVNFSDAETIAWKEYDGFTFDILAIKKSKVADFIGEITAELFFIAKIKVTVLDEGKGKEKTVVQPVLIGANDIDEAKSELNKWLEVFLVPVEVKSIGVSPITEILV